MFIGCLIAYPTLACVTYYTVASYFIKGHNAYAENISHKCLD